MLLRYKGDVLDVTKVGMETNMILGSVLTNFQLSWCLSTDFENRTYAVNKGLRFGCKIESTDCEGKTYLPLPSTWVTINVGFDSTSSRPSVVNTPS